MIGSDSLSEKKYLVRRLTPLECTRLQGLPDGWVDIGEWVDSKGKKHKDADSPKYKALGNGIACPFWYQLLSNITEELRNSDNEVREQYTQGSLFSGIGSFDLLWDKINGKGASKWSSDIEEFPIAVMKYHFGDEDAGIEGDLDNYLKGADIVEGETING